MAVRVAVHQPSPDRPLAIWLDSAPELSCTDSTQAHGVDVEHQPTDLMVTRSLLGVGCWAWRPARKMWMPNWNESSVEMRASSGQDEPARLP